MPQKSSEESFDVPFPLNGLDLSGEFGVQRPGTTAKCMNARAIDPLLERARGGSRHGLTKYPNDQLPGSSGTVTESFTAAGAGSWVAPANIVGTMTVEGWGAGGRPPDGTASDGSNGGGGGEYAKLTAFTPTAGATYNYFIGTGDVISDTDGEDTTFNSTSLIAKGGKADGTGGTGGTGDVTNAGGDGGLSGSGLGGGGGGAGGGNNTIGNPGDDGLPVDISGSGGLGGAGGGDGGAGATGAIGSETLAVAGSQAGGGGGGGSSGTSGSDPIYWNSARGGDGQIILTYTVASPVQHLNQLVLTDTNFLLTGFENYEPNFIADSSSNNFPDGRPPGSLPAGDGTRNPDRDIPPDPGTGTQPNRKRPLADRKRIQIVPSATTANDGDTVTLTITLSGLPGTVPEAGLVYITTNPPRASGDGAQRTTSGAGTATLNVSESSYEGTVQYIATHIYVDAITGRTFGTRGLTRVTWKPNYTLKMTAPYARLKSPLTPSADPMTTQEIADFVANKANQVRCRLTHSITGAPIAGKTIKMTATVDVRSPFDGCISTAPVPTSFSGQNVKTDAQGYAYFTSLTFDAQNRYVFSYSCTYRVQKASGTVTISSDTTEIDVYTDYCQ